MSKSKQDLGCNEGGRCDDKETLGDALSDVSNIVNPARVQLQFSKSRPTVVIDGPCIKSSPNLC